mmetsp:Transcript_51562/g.144124  ORF Transcript_51562/g.144124 Transcript_51562/m.144124 type:complete len:146 (-) Transcript_51562:502-939(-)
MLLVHLLLLLSSATAFVARPWTPPGRHLVTLRAAAVAGHGRVLPLYMSAVQEAEEEASAEDESAAAAMVGSVVTLKPNAQKHLQQMKASLSADPLYIRIGVRTMEAGVTGTLRKDGKSEYTYKMDVCEKEDLAETDHVDEFSDLG